MAKTSSKYLILALNGGQVDGAAITKYPSFPSKGISVNLDSDLPVS